MSKFTSIVDEALTKTQQAQAGTQAAIAAAKAAEVAGKTDPTKKPTSVQQKLLQGLKKATMSAGKKLATVAMQSNKPTGKVIEAEGDDFVPRQGPETGGEFEPTTPDSLAQGEEPPAETEPLTTEGETFYVNLSRKCLFVDLDNADLNDAERQAITQDVQPENAKEIAKILRKVVSDYGLGESFNSKIDSLIENLELKDLSSSISIEDLKKNLRDLIIAIE